MAYPGVGAYSPAQAAQPQPLQGYPSFPQQQQQQQPAMPTAPTPGADAFQSQQAQAQLQAMLAAAGNPAQAMPTSSPAAGGQLDPQTQAMLAALQGGGASTGAPSAGAGDIPANPDGTITRRSSGSPESSSSAEGGGLMDKIFSKTGAMVAGGAAVFLAACWGIKKLTDSSSEQKSDKKTPEQLVTALETKSKELISKTITEALKVGKNQKGEIETLEKEVNDLASKLAQAGKDKKLSDEHQNKLNDLETKLKALFTDAKAKVEKDTESDRTLAPDTITQKALTDLMGDIRKTVLPELDKEEKKEEKAG